MKKQIITLFIFLSLSTYGIATKYKNMTLQQLQEEEQKAQQKLDMIQAELNKHQDQAQTPKLLGYKQIGDKIVYTYEVSGEDINDPKATSNLYGMTNVPYALCSKALCTIDKNNPGKATCVCPIYGLKDDKNWQKASVGPKNLMRTKPTRENGILKTVVSNYSMANIKNRNDIPQTTCLFNKPTPWANCFGVRCKVRFNKDTSKLEAVCECPLVKSKKIVSIGPKNTADCQKNPNQAWSAATKSQGQNNNYIMTAIYMKMNIQQLQEEKQKVQQELQTIQATIQEKK